MNRDDHPAWCLYDLWRTARLNEAYYSARIHALETTNFVMEIAIAVTAPGGTISALWFWNTDLGSVLWKILLPVAAIVAVLKPLLNLVERIKKMETCLSGYRLLVYDSAALIEELKRKRDFDQELLVAYKSASDKVRLLITQNPETQERKWLKERITAHINSSLMDYKFFIPEGDNA
jgi:hypothetical protein